MKRALLLLSLILTWSAAAAAADTAANPGSISRPIATGTPHLCLDYYPPLAKRFDVQGNTMVRLVIAEDGTVRDPVVRNSSGSELLDQASLDCVKNWIYVPAKRDGVPIAANWAVEIKWYMNHDFEGPAADETPPPGAKWILPAEVHEPPHQCQASFNSLSGQISVVGPTSLSFTITKNGSTTDVVVTRSSGNDIYDQTAVACIKRWRYAPATHDGVPVSFRWLARVGWPEIQR